MKYLKNPWVITALIVVIIVGFFAIRGRRGQAQEEVITVKRGTVREEVNVTGKVKAAQAVDLAFERSGKVVKISKDVGDRVSAGDMLVEIDNRDAAAQLAQARAALLYQQSKLSELKAGTRPEQIAITQTKAESAKSDLTNARITLGSALQNAYTSADDAIRNKVDEFFVYPRSSNPQLIFASTITSETSLESGRVEVEKRLRNMKETISTFSTSTNPRSVLNEMKQDLGEIKLFLDNVSLAVNALVPDAFSSLTEAKVTGWKTNLSAARTSVNAAITSVLTSEDKLRAAEAAYDVASRQLTLDTSGVVSQEIEAQQAQVAQAEASVSSVYAQYLKAYIKAPITGVVTKQEARVGETISPNVTVISLMSDALFEIEANIPEADIAKVKAGQTARVTLDAYGPDVVFTAHVASIDPAETIVDGVPTYKTTLQFSDADDRIKSGMTANVDIHGQVHEQVLFVPQRALINRNGEKYATIKTGDTKKEVAVKTGLRGFDGSIEILDGLSEGDSIIVSDK